MSVARFLEALRAGETQQAFDELRAHPELPRYSLHAAAAVADADRVAAFLEADPSSATRPSEDGGPEPIIFACHAGLADLLGVSADDRLRTVALLLDAGASPNATVSLDHDPHVTVSALYFASVSNNVPVVQLLLESGANPNDGESLYHAAEKNHQDCLDLLMAYGADLSGRDARTGNTPLYFLAGYKESNAGCADATAGMLWLLEHGADPNVASHVDPQPDGTPGLAEMPLHRLASNGRGGEIGRAMLAYGALVDAPRGDGKTAYALALRAGNAAMASVLAEHGADTANLTPVDRFLAACARADAAAARNVLEECPELPDAFGADDYAVILTAIENGRVESVRVMLTLGWSLVHEGPWGGTPLHWAAWFGRQEVVRLLLDQGAPVNARDSQYGSSALAWAAHGSRFSRPGNDRDYLLIVDLLLAAGATRAESFNAWNESPESMASELVARRMTEAGFAT